jgi:predicted permease
MTWFRSLWERLWALFRRKHLDKEMEEEVRFHLEMEEKKNLERGMTPSEAHRQAMIAFGGVDRFQEKTREERGMRPLEDLARDLRFALRSLRKSPGVVLVTVLSLGLGIAASATVFSVANAFLLGDPGPIRDPETIITVYASEEGGRLYGETSFPDYLDIRDGTEAIQDLAAHRVGVVSVGDPENRDRIIVELVTGNFFQVLGVSPHLGRGFLPEESVIGRAEHLFVLSYRAWQERFGGDRGVLGTTIELDGRPFTIIGVAPEGLMGRYVQMDLDGWLPLGVPEGLYRATPASLADRRSQQFFMVGRLEAGRTLEEAQAELVVLADRLHAEYGASWEDSRGEPKALTAVSEARSRMPPDGRVALLGLFAFFLVGALSILALACSNVASLLLARAQVRAQEMAIRTSLGAGRGRLMRMLLSESLLLAALGGGLGLYLTHLATGYVRSFPLPFDVPLRFDFSLDLRVVLFTLAVSLGASVLAGVGPALQGSKANLSPALKWDGGRSLGRRRKFTLRSLLVVGQVAAATVLVFGAGLAVRSVQASTSYDVGLNGEGVAVMWKEPPPERLPPRQLRDHFSEMAARIRSHPEVETVALARTAEAHLFMEDFATAVLDLGEEEPPEVRFNAVTPGYLEMMEIPLIRGRGFQDTDVVGANPVAVVNETFLERYLPGTSGVGELITVSAWMDAGRRQDRERTTLEVVGVVAAPLRPDGNRARPFFWVSYLQDVPVRAIIHAKGRGAAEALVPILRREAPPRSNEFTLIDPGPYQSLIDYRFLGHRLTSTVLRYTGLFALALAFIGVFGIVSYNVSQRFREMAIRQAMGAQVGQVFRAVLGHGLKTTGVGMLVGLLLAVPVAFLARSALLGVAPMDPWALAGGTGILMAAAILAGLIPALRLRASQPMEVLRDE